MHALTRLVSISVATLVVAVRLSMAAGGSPEPLPDPDGKPADMRKPVQVYILMGQSNMLGFGKVAGGDGSLEYAVKEKHKYPYLIDDAGAWTIRKDVRNVRVMNFADHLNDWMTISGKHIGPEIGIGHYIGNATDAPVLILKSCIGNRSLGWDLLPPGSEPYEFEGKMVPGYRGTPDNPKGNGEKVADAWYAGKQYDDDTDSAKQVLSQLSKYYPGAKDYEVVGFCFWQGAKDSGSAENSSRYEKNLVQFIKQLRKDFNAPNANFVVASMGQTQEGAGGNEGKILEAQLAVDGKKGKYPEFKGNVASVYSNPFCHGGSANGHYSGHAETYMDIGEAMGRAMVELLEQAPQSRMGRGPSARPSAPALRPARKLAAGKQDALNRALLTSLVKLSDAGLLKPTPIPLSMTRARVTLVSVNADNVLTFRSDSGKTVDISPENLKPGDFANLAVLVSQLKPDSTDARALAGVYLECLGHVELADKKYAEAGPESTAKMAAFLE